MLFSKLRLIVVSIILLNTFIYSTTDTVNLTLRGLKNQNFVYSGSATDFWAGGYTRSAGASYSYEILAYDAMSSYIGSGRTIDSVKIRYYISSVHTGGSYSDLVFLVHTQNKGAYSSTASYDTYSLTPWSDTLAITTHPYNVSTGWYSIKDTRLKNLVQAWVDSTQTNNGIIVAGDPNYFDYYLILSNVQLIIDYSTNSNQAPTNISLSPSSVNENQSSGTYVGKLTTTDPDAGDTHTYSLVSGTGDADNTYFSVSNDTLFTATTFNYEIKSSCSVRIRTTDNGGLYYEKALTITINNINDTPSDIIISNNSVEEGQTIGTVVGVFSTTDDDAGDSHTYSLVAGSGDTDNAKFSISGDTLKTAAVLSYATNPTCSIRIRSTDNGAGNLYTEKTFTITVIETENPSDWKSSMNIYINTTPNGANISTDVYNFPLLIRLNPGNFSDFANTQPGGADIRFVKSDGTTFLAYEIEEWKDGVNDNDTASIWVKIDTVFGNNSSQYIKMLWNKSGETSQANAANVYSNNYAGVWHFNEEAAGTGNTGTYADKTQNENNADDYVSANAQDGISPDGQKFDGTDDYIKVNQNTSLNLTTATTISGWFKLDNIFNSSSTSSAVIVTKYQNADNNLSIVLAGSDFDYPLVTTGSLVFKVENQDKYSDSFRFVWTNNRTWAPDRWYHFAVILDNSNSANNKIYIDGADDTY